MTIPKPPGHLAPSNPRVLESGTVLHRIHDQSRSPTAFNPCRGRPTRFAPIEDDEGRCVPSLYAGSTFDSAAYETLFRGIPVHAHRKTAPLSAVISRAHGTFQPLRDLTLASLRAPDLAKWGVSRDALIASSPQHYQETAAWAKAIHDQCPRIEGLVWTSSQCDPDDAYLFFGDRVRPGDLRIVSVRDGSSDPAFLADVRLAGQRAGITIVI